MILFSRDSHETYGSSDISVNTDVSLTFVVQLDLSSALSDFPRTLEPQIEDVL